MWYHWLSVLSFLTAVLLTNFATAVMHWDEMRVKHTWNAIPANWESLGNTTAGAIINLHIALKPDRADALTDALSEVSNPRHPRYGAHLSKEQLAELVNPHPNTLELVRAWLAHHGIRPSSISTTHGGSWLTVTDVPVPQANQLLGASYRLYRNSMTNKTIIRTVGYALPAVLHSHIQTVAPTTYFPSARGMWQTPLRRSFGAAPVQEQVASGKHVTVRQDQGITPSVLRWLYKTSEYTPTKPEQNKLGILGINDEYPSAADLTQFMTGFRPDEEDQEEDAVTFTVSQWNGGEYSPSNPSNHANIGMQYAAAMAYPATFIFYSLGGDMDWAANGEPIAGDMYLVWLNKILEQTFPPLTISISYGHHEQDLPVDYALSLCHLFALLGARGITVLAASGIDGVGAENCVNADGDYHFMPEFPSTCPYVTSVGGTTHFRPEAAANLSGGGFSYFFDRPPFQRRAVPKYMRRIPDSYDGLYNRIGRGYPDISAQALNYEVVVNGERYYANGTTCAVSTAAGIVSLMNDFRIFHNRRPLGWLNPWLYSDGVGGVKDIKFGGNPGCNTNGFLASAGWDPVTGLGTLDLEKILGIFWDAWENAPDSSSSDGDDGGGE